MPSWFFFERNGTIRYLIAGAIIGLFAGGAQSLVAEENCCSRSFAVLPASMPEGQFHNWGNQIAAAISSAFTAKGGELRHCPLELEEHDFEGGEWLSGLIDKLSAATGAAPSGLSPQQMALYGMDYLIVSSVSVADKQFAATVTLLDHHHGQTVKSGVYSWSGEPTGFGPGFEAWVEATFNPLDDLIYDYERKPQLCRLTLQGDSPTVVQAGATVTVRLSEIFDHQSRPSQKWQRVYVKAEKGKILNGREKGEYRVFDVGDGNLSVTYKAPDTCKSDKETITVRNTCYTKNNPDGTPQDVAPDKEIGKKEFDIVCNRWRIELTSTMQFSGKEQPSSNMMTRTLGGSYTATVKAVVEYVKTVGHDRIYESKSFEFDLNDTFNQHIVLTDKDLTCEGRIAWTGTNSGVVQVPVHMTLNVNRKRCSFGFSTRPVDPPISYKVGINLWGDERCGGARAWSGEFQVTDPPFYTTGTDAPDRGQATMMPYSPGQTEIEGQDEWTSKLWGRVSSWGELKIPIEQFPGMARVMVVLLTQTTPRSGNNNIVSKSTLHWKATKLGQKD